MKTNSASANPAKNSNWREVHQQRLAELQETRKTWQDLASRNELAEVEKEAFLLCQEATALNKFIATYHNHQSDEDNKWRKKNGFMSGKSVFIDGAEKFWIFKTPGETRTDDNLPPFYVKKDRENKISKTTEQKSYNIRYSRGFLEVYSLAEILLPDKIMPYAVAQKIKHPDQFFVATEFVWPSRFFSEADLANNEMAEQFKNLRLIGSIIGFDDMIYSNVLVDKDEKIKAIDAVNPVSDNNIRRDFFALIKRNFFDFRGMLGGCRPEQENVSQYRFEELKEEYPIIALRVLDLRKLSGLLEERTDEIEELFRKIAPFNDEKSRSIENYFRENLKQLKFLCEHENFADLDDEYLLNREEILQIEKNYKSPRTPKVATASRITQIAEKEMVKNSI